MAQAARSRRPIGTDAAATRPTTAASDPLQEELVRLRSENARLQARLTQAETSSEVQKKVAQLLGANRPPRLSDER